MSHRSLLIKAVQGGHNCVNHTKKDFNFSKNEHPAVKNCNCCKVCLCFADTPSYQHAQGYGQPPSYPGHQPPVYYPPPVPPQPVAGYMNPMMQPQQWHNNSNNNDSHNSNSHSENRAISNNVTIVQGPQQQAASTPTIGELYFLFMSTDCYSRV